MPRASQNGSWTSSLRRIQAEQGLPQLVEQEPKRPLGLTVKWMVFRGPADVRFDPLHAQPRDGKATTTAYFSEPGEYSLRASAEDGLLTTFGDVSVKVTKR